MKNKYVVDIKIILFTILGSVLTYVIQHYLGFNSVIAASAVGILGAVVFSAYAPPIYMGAFLGMVSTTVIGSSLLLLVVASIIAGILFIISKRYFVGYGGKLGFMAFISVLVVVLLSQIFSQGDVFETVYIKNDIITIAVFVATGAVVAYLTNYLNKKNIFETLKTKSHNRVLGSALVGLFTGMFFPALFKDIGMNLAVLSFVASFIGMTSHKVFKRDWEYLVAGGLSGLVFIVFVPYFVGFGGKAGTTAFMAVFLYIILRKLIKEGAELLE